MSRIVLCAVSVLVVAATHALAAPVPGIHMAAEPLSAAEAAISTDFLASHGSQGDGPVARQGLPTGLLAWLAASEDAVERFLAWAGAADASPESTGSDWDHRAAVDGDEQPAGHWFSTAAGWVETEAAWTEDRIGDGRVAVVRTI